MQPGYAQEQGGQGAFTINWPSAGDSGQQTTGTIFNQGDDGDDDDDLYS